MAYKDNKYILFSIGLTMFFVLINKNMFLVKKNRNNMIPIFYNYFNIISSHFAF